MKKKLTVLDITICAAMIAVHIVLDLFLSIRIGESFKLTFSSLPFVVVAMLCGPAEGFISGLVGGFLSQLLGPYGIMVTTPIWIVPAAMEALTAGLIFKAFKRKTTIPAIAITVFIADFVLVIFNWFGSYLGDIVILKDMTIETLLGVTPIRLIKWVVISIIYTIILVPLTKVLLKSCPAGIRQARKNAQMAAAAAGTTVTVDVPVSDSPVVEEIAADEAQAEESAEEAAAEAIEAVQEAEPNQAETPAAEAEQAAETTEA